jgi:hypothetical protein
MQAEDALGDAEGNPENMVAAAEAFVALAATAEQQAGALPVKGQFFSPADLSPDAGMATSFREGSGEDVSESEESGSLNEGAEEERRQWSDEAGPSARGRPGAGEEGGGRKEREEDEEVEEEEGGYGEGGLSWQAVMAQVLGQVRCVLHTSQTRLWDPKQKQGTGKQKRVAERQQCVRW